MNLIMLLLKLICLSGWIALTTACTSSSVLDESPHQEGAPITFGTEVTRGIVGLQKTGMQPFAVWGGYDQQHNLFDAQEVAPNGTYSGTRYWAAGKLHDFYAVHPYPTYMSKVSVTCTPQGTLTIQGYDGATHRGEYAVDLMTAKATQLSYEPPYAPAPVSLNFKHELAWVEFVIASEQPIEVEYVKLTNVAYRGDFTISPQNPEAQWSQLQYSDPTTGEPFRDKPFSLDQIMVNKAVYLLGGDLLLPPQPITDQCVFSMKWYYPGVAGESREVHVQLPLAGVTTWEKGKHYVYSAIVPPTPVDITLRVSVEPWKVKHTDVIL